MPTYNPTWLEEAAEVTPAASQAIETYIKTRMGSAAMATHGVKMLEIIGKQHPPPSQDKREGAAKEWHETHRAKNRKERRRALAEIRKVERGDYS